MNVARHGAYEPDHCTQPARPSQTRSSQNCPGTTFQAPCNILSGLHWCSVRHMHNKCPFCCAIPIAARRYLATKHISEAQDSVWAPNGRE